MLDNNVPSIVSLMIPTSTTIEQEALTFSTATSLANPTVTPIPTTITTATTITTTTVLSNEIEVNNASTHSGDSLTPSDGSEHEFNAEKGIELRGYLSKWTNYIYGWQPRYIVLKDGTLSYYKSESESDFGCRGAISLSKATIKTHESDELRFDVVVNNYNNWCLRADTPEDRVHWVEVLQLYKEESTSTPDTASLRRHGSTVSLQSNTVSLASESCLKMARRRLKEKVHELETFKDILISQIETIQKYDLK